MLEIGADRILHEQRGTFNLAGIKLTFTKWLDSYYYKDRTGPQSFVVSKLGPDVFGLYPWGVTDAGVEIFARSPAVVFRGAPVGSKIISPVESPSIKVDRHGTHVILPELMKEALYRFEPEFRLLDAPDSKSLLDGPSAILGDFDGDLLPDIALLGSSGADQVVISILSNHANIRVAEVAWQRLPLRPGEKQSRGDPVEAQSIHLELAPRGSQNPFCWVDGPSYFTGTPVDAVGIVLAGSVRFDYVWRQNRFVVWNTAGYKALPGD